MKETKKHLKRRIWALTLILAMVTGFIPGTSMVAKADTESYTISVGSASVTAELHETYVIPDTQCLGDISVKIFTYNISGTAMFCLLDAARSAPLMVPQGAGVAVGLPATFSFMPTTSSAGIKESIAGLLSVATDPSNMQLVSSMVYGVSSTAHTHKWNYAVNTAGNELTATCGNTTGKVTLAAPATVEYTGKAITDVKVTNTLPKDANVTVGAVNYEGVSPTTYTKSTTAPTAIGTYKATVAVGNESLTANFEIRDTAKPVVKGIADGKTYCGDTVITVTDAQLESVTVNGTAVSLDANGKYTLKADGTEYTVVAKDKANNTTTVKATVKTHTWNEWKTVQEATANLEGKKERTCKNGCGKKQVSVVAKAGVEDKYENVAQCTIVGEGAPETVINTSKDNLIDAEGVLTEEEKAQVKAGADANLWLEVNKLTAEDIETEDKTKIEDAAKSVMGKDTELTYFDASFFKQIGTGATTSISELGTNLSISIALPKELVNADKSVVRTFSILRLHEGKVDVIKATYDPTTGNLTFETDKFSTYAIAYKDVPADQLKDAMDDGDLEDGEESDAEYMDKTPSTGDNKNLFIWITLMIMCGAAIAVIVRKKFVK